MCFKLGFVSIFHIFLFQHITAELKYLSDDNFDTEIPKHTVLFANFFHPQCMHSQQLDPQFTKAERTMSTYNLPVSFAKVNCDGNGRGVCERLGVKAYPVIKVFNFGEYMFNYEGPKEAESMVKFLKFKLEAGSQKLDGLADLSACMAGFDNVIIGFFHNSKSQLENTFNQLAESLKAEYKFAHTYSARVMSTFGYRDEIVLFRSDKLKTTLEQSQVKFEGKATLYNLRNWIASIYQGLAGYRTRANIEQFKAPLVVAYLHVDFERQSSTSNYYRNRMIMTARRFQKAVNGVRERVTFAVSDLGEFKRDLEEFGIKEIPADKNAILVTVRDSAQRKYLLNETIVFSSEAVEQFVNDVFDRKVDPFIKSEHIPQIKTDEKSYVLTAVGKTFEGLVMDDKADVLVQLFAPWSSDCRNALALLNKVAKKLKDEDGLRVVKIDVTANEVPSPYALRGYPSVYLAKRYRKGEPLFYEGKQTVKDYISFLAENTTFPLKKYNRSGVKSVTTPTPQTSIKTEL